MNECMISTVYGSFNNLIYANTSTLNPRTLSCETLKECGRCPHFSVLICAQNIRIYAMFYDENAENGIGAITFNLCKFLRAKC